MPQSKDDASDATVAPRSDALAALRIKRPEPTADRRPRSWKWILAVLLLMIAIAGGAGYRWSVAHGWKPPAWLDFSGDAGSNWVPTIIQNRPEARLASLDVQSGRSADAVVVATGYVESRRQARIGARAPGRIEVIHFEEGTKVKAHEVLAILEHADMDASLAAAEASVTRAKAGIDEQGLVIDQAKREAERAESLWQQRSISESERDQVKFAYESAVARKGSLVAELELAEARRREAEQLRENMYIRAPFDGTVISKDAEVGESILPGGMGEASGRGSVATIADLAHLEVECDVKEDYITRITEGQSAEIAVDAVPSKKYRGVVRKVIPMGDRARATIKVQVEILDIDSYLFPDMSGTVYFLPRNDVSEIESDMPRIFCPSSAVTQEPSGASYVWIVDASGRARRSAVTIGETRDGKTEIRSGLSGTQRVVTNPGSWSDGQAVKVIE